MRPPRAHKIIFSAIRVEYGSNSNSRRGSIVVVVVVVLSVVVVVANDCFEIFTTASFVSYFHPTFGTGVIRF